MILRFGESNGPVDQAIERVMDMAGGVRHPEIIRDMIIAALKAGQEEEGRADLKLMDTTLKEMRFTSRIFGRYGNVKKVTVFGSARTGPEEPLYKLAHRLGRKVARMGWMVITGAGGGIMQAVNEGAGRAHSFGVNIRLPFEQKPNPILVNNPRLITYKYFFNRKVAFLKEADAIVLFPGGFGTLDEAMETLTLVQTGKRYPLPLILVDDPKGDYWLKWRRFLEDELLSRRYISPSDFNLFELVNSVNDAIAGIERFYRRYHSMRYVEEKLVIRLNTEIDRKSLRELGRLFKSILIPGGKIYTSGALPQEEDEPEISALPRLVVDFNRRDFGSLRSLIDTINDF